MGPRRQIKDCRGSPPIWPYQLESDPARLSFPDPSRLREIHCFAPRRNSAPQLAKVDTGQPGPTQTPIRSVLAELRHLPQDLPADPVSSDAGSWALSWGPGAFSSAGTPHLRRRPRREQDADWASVSSSEAGSPRPRARSGSNDREGEASPSHPASPTH